MKRLALIGSKDFAAQIRKFAEDTGEFVVVGYFDDFEAKGTIIRSLPVLGATNEIEDIYKKDVFDCIFLASGYNDFKFREAVFNRYSTKIPFANIISPAAKIGLNVTIGEGVYIGPNATIGMNSVIGDNVFLHGGTRLGHDNQIGSHSYFSGRIDTAGFCTIGKRCFVGICVCMADHLSVCDDVWIGLGCIVARSIKKPGKYVSPSVKLIKIE